MTATENAHVWKMPLSLHEQTEATLATFDTFVEHGHAIQCSSVLSPPPGVVDKQDLSQQLDQEAVVCVAYT
tara:strand:- start:62 stop:274 length:213 start_codon:yes stop_codon:yes gene_type:complete